MMKLDYSITPIIIFLSILTIIIILCTIILEPKNNSINNEDTVSLNQTEHFANYQDVKTKTLNWCNKMQKVGLLTPDQFNQCVSSFKDASAGLLPKNFKTPQTGMQRNYSLYNSNTQQKDLTSDITGDNTNTIMLANIDGLTLGCKTDNSIYLISNINDPKINQSEMYFTLVPQNEDVYAILSPYGKYLIANTDYTASFTGTSIGPMASWKITKITTTTNQKADNSSNVIISSLQFNDFSLVYDTSTSDKKANPFKIIYGRADNMIWTMTSKLQNNENNGNETSNYDGVEYYVAKENILQKIKTTNAQKICIQEAIKTFTKLSEQIGNNFNNIINYVNKKLSDDQNTYKLSLLDYETRVNSLNQNSMINEVARANILSTIPPPSGLNISDDDIMIAINKITNNKNALLQNLQSNILNPLKQKLDELNGLNLETDYNKFLDAVKTDIDDTNNRISQNNTIMNRQKDTYTKINRNYSNQITKQKKIQDTDNIANANIQMINNFNEQNSYLNKVYPVAIFILAILTIYLSYITFIKFRDNIYMNY